jgi:hypothetical protein
MDFVVLEVFVIWYEVFSQQPGVSATRLFVTVDFYFYIISAILCEMLHNTGIE